MTKSKILQITLESPKNEKKWPVSATLTTPDGVIHQCESQLIWDEDWDVQLRSLSLDYKQYGRYLGQALFRDGIHELCNKALGDLQATHFHLLIKHAALKEIHWEDLCYPDETNSWLPLSLDQRFLFSFYSESISPRIYPMLHEKDLNALVLIYSPKKQFHEFQPFDVKKVADQIEDDLNKIPHTFLFQDEDATWENLLEHLRTGSYSLLHIFSHCFHRDGGSFLLLQDKQHKPFGISADRFIEEIRQMHQLPNLIFLNSPGTSFFASQIIAQLGTPFVIATTGKLTLETARKISSGFYQRLYQTGQVDLALTNARINIRDRKDNIKIVLYQKQPGVPLFNQGEDKETHDATDSSSNNGHILGRIANAAPDKLKDYLFDYIAGHVPDELANHIVNNASAHLTQLQIDHNGYQDEKPLFNVKRLVDGKESKSVTLTPPGETAMEGTVASTASNLQQELHWYLEEFPSSLQTTWASHADHVEKNLEVWGKECFSRLFQENARDWFQDARKNGLENLRLKIASDDPKVLAWSWEALRDWDGKPLAQLCHIERQLNDVSDPMPLPDNLPQNCINILLVIARPKGDKDVSIHALSRPLLELIRKEQLPIRLDVLRPPTFNQLRDTLHNKPGHYHIVHFDGHGAYQTEQRQGVLLFENEAGEPNLVDADKLATLLHEYRIPIMILNACQSAQIDEQAEDAFASVAASLLKAGIRSVVAMGYLLYVGSAKHFVPAFYRRLVESGDVGEALRAGRQAMFADNMRVAGIYEYPLQDWLVPILYQQLPQNEQVLPKLTAIAADPLPVNKDIPTLGAYGFIGRERMVQKLERALLRQKQAGILIHGLKGIGKTTLLIGFIQWLRDTNGLPTHFHWFDFSNISSLAQVTDKLLAALPNIGAASLPLDQKLDRLVSVLQTTPHLMVWDNVEAASGNSTAGTSPQLPPDDLLLLKNFFRQLRSGKVNKTKILLASDQPETWLEHTECFRLKLDGLETDECWEFASAVLDDLGDFGLKVKRANQDFKFLLEDLGAHPLAMQRALPHLEGMDTSAINTLRKALRDNASDGASDTVRFIGAAIKLWGS